METDEEFLISLSAGVNRMEGQQQEFKREVLRRLDVLEDLVRTAPQVRRASAAAVVSIAAGVVSCAARFLSWHR
jgi:hypothetical protein